MGEIDLKILEVDGSLANPYAAGAVLVWAAIVSVVAVLAVRSRTTAALVVRVSLLGALLLFTSRAQHALGWLLYWVTDPRISGVGFWGGPPRWIAPAAASGAGLVAWLHARRARH